MYIVATMVIIILGGYYLFSGNTSENSGGNAGSGDVQKVTLSMKNYNYYPNTIKVQVGSPVEITLDNSVRGCFRDFTIRAFNIHQYSKTPDQTINFTPTKSGVYTFACSMGMGSGTLIVEENK